MPNAVINANSQIGQHVIINTGAIIEHDNPIGHCTHVTSNATLCEGVRIKAFTQYQIRGHCCARHYDWFTIDY